MVRKGGLEPPQPCGHKNLNLARLPIPPLSHAPEEQRGALCAPRGEYYREATMTCQMLFGRREPKRVFEGRIQYDERKTSPPAHGA